MGNQCHLKLFMHCISYQFEGKYVIIACKGSFILSTIRLYTNPEAFELGGVCEVLCLKYTRCPKPMQSSLNIAVSLTFRLLQ